jgi:hypothetical protein
MSALFGFFLRLFICFVAAKFLLNALGVAGRGYLLALTGLLLANVYWLRYLLFREQRPFTEPGPQAPAPPPESPPAPPPEPPAPGPAN